MTTEYGSVETVAMNKNIVQRYYDEFLRPCDLDHASEIISYDLKSHSTFDMDQGLSGFRDFMASFTAAFPDIKYDIKEMIAEADKVAVLLDVTATNRGEFIGRSPTGKKVEFRKVDIFRLERGKIVELWDVLDKSAIFEQLGWARIP